MNRFIFTEPALCIGCGTCMAACSVVHRAAGLQAQPRLVVTRTMQATAPVTCRHCEDAPCARVCPVDAIHVRADDVQLDEQRCIGCKMCALACPFGAISPGGTPVGGVAGMRIEPANDCSALDPILAWDIGVKTVAVKCDLCEFQEHGPECVRVCPTAALHLNDAGALGEDVAARRRAAAAHGNPAFGLGEHPTP